MKKSAWIIFALLLFTGCLRLDDNLYNQQKLNEYLLDDYSGHVDFTLDSTFQLADSLIYHFTLQSKAYGEANASTIHAVYIGAISEIATDTVILYCHGNRDHMDFYWPRAKLLAHAGHKNRFGVLLFDYRGFGMSEGKPTEDGLYADAAAALNWLKEKGLNGNRLVMYGFSMGTAPATKLTAEPGVLRPCKLLLEAPFANAETMVQDASGLALPGSFVTGLQINNGEVIKLVQQPFLWIHGEEDDFLNINTHGQVVYQNYNGAYREAHRIPVAGHSTIQTTMGFQAYLKTITDFITLH